MNNDERHRKLFGLYFGEVVRRNDPENRGRVKFRVPGLVDDESAEWAVQIGVNGSGHAQSGGPFHPPPVGANVAIFFEQGDPDSPAYLAGPWGAPDGVSDAPTDSAVEGDDRQNAVLEDQEWLIERDSRTAAQVWRVKHKSGSAEIVIHGTDRIDLVRDGATEAVPIGTTYRAAEAAFLNDFFGAVAVFATAAKASADPTLASSASALETAMGAVTNQDMKDDATAYLSEKLFTE